MRKKIFLGLAIFIVSLFAYNIIVQIVSAARSTERLNTMTNNLTELQKQNSNLKREFERVQTPEFIERQARDKLGMSKKGETIVVIPDEKIKEVLGGSKSAEIKKIANWLGWWKLFFP